MTKKSPQEQISRLVIKRDYLAANHKRRSHIQAQINALTMRILKPEVRAIKNRAAGQLELLGM